MPRIHKDSKWKKRKIVIGLSAAAILGAITIGYIMHKRKDKRWVIDLKEREREKGWVSELDSELKFTLTNGPSAFAINGSPVTLYSVREIPSDPKKQQNKLTMGNIYVGDVSFLMVHSASTNTEKVDAIFQAASQFNLLEMANPDITPDKGVSIYATDYTQGPAVAIAGGYATIFRNYFMNPTPLPNRIVGISDEWDASKPASWGQITRQYNGLQSVCNLFSDEIYMENGYFLPPKEVLEKNTSEMIAELAEMTLGFHPIVELTSADYGEKRLTHRSYVGQVFASACPITYSRIPENIWEEFARAELEQTYFLTLLSAMYAPYRGKKVNLYLTLVGGGAFGNSVGKVVLPAIERAMKRFKDRHDGLNVACHMNVYDWLALNDTDRSTLFGMGFDGRVMHEQDNFPGGLIKSQF